MLKFTACRIETLPFAARSMFTVKQIVGTASTLLAWHSQADTFNTSTREEIWQLTQHGGLLLMVTMRRLSVKAIIPAAEKIHAQINLCWHAKILYSAESLGGDFLFQQLFSSSNQNQLKDWDLICCHSSPA